LSVDASGLSVICRVDDRLCALPIDQVIETLRPLPIESMSGGKVVVLGLSVIRGSPTPVVDLAAVLGCVRAGEQAAAPTGRFVVVRAGDRRVALAVDEVMGVRTIDPASLRALPPLLRGASATTLSAIGTLDEQFLLVLRSAGLVVDAHPAGQGG